MVSLADWQFRRDQLVRSRWNTASLPPRAVTFDLSTDVRTISERPVLSPHLDLADTVEEMFNFPFTVPTHLGRGAEALLADLMVPGGLVLANEVYTTSAWLIQRRGGRVVELASRISNTGDVDLLALRTALESEVVTWVHITLPRVRLGAMAGGKVTLTNLRGIRETIDSVAPDVPMVLDASRIWENAARLPVSETSGSLSDDVRAISSLADIMVLSGRKDAGGAHAGLAATRSPVLASRLKRACYLLEGKPESGGTSGPEREQLVTGLRNAHVDAKHNWQQTKRLASQLAEAGVPILRCGSGSIFFDAQAWLPLVSQQQCPAQTLAALLYLHGGIKVLARAVTETGLAVVRLAVNSFAGQNLSQSLSLMFASVRDHKSGLRVVGGPLHGPFTEALEPVVAGHWERWQPLSISSQYDQGCSDSEQLQASTIDIRDELHRRLGLPDNWIVLVAPRERGPQSLLTEAWSRMGGAISTGDPVLRGLAEYWVSKGSVSNGQCMHLIPFDMLDQVLAKKNSADSVAVDAGSMASLCQHSQSLVDQSRSRVRAWWCCTGAGGLLLLNRDDPLVEAIRDASLFFCGGLSDGGLSPAVRQQLLNSI